jgi:hypothetical protein
MQLSVTAKVAIVLVPRSGGALLIYTRELIQILPLKGAQSPLGESEACTRYTS